MMHNQPKPAFDASAGSRTFRSAVLFVAYNPTFHRAVDILFIMGVGGAGLAVRLGGLYPETIIKPAVQAYLFSAWTVGVFLWVALGLHRVAAAFSTWRDAARIVFLAGGTILLALLSGYLADRLDGIPRSLPVFHFGMLVAGLCGIRFLARGCAVLTREGQIIDAFARQDSLLLGDVALASVYIGVLREEHSSTSTIAGLLTVDPIDRETLVNSVPILGRPEDVREVLQELKVHGVVVRQVVLLCGRDRIPAELFSFFDRQGIELVDFYSQLMDSFGPPAAAG